MNNPIILFSSRLVSSVPNEVPNEEKIPEQPDKNKALLNLIYGVDENTGLPCGDLSMYLSPKTNPEVRNFIEMNLMRNIIIRNSSTHLIQNIIRNRHLRFTV